jgi:hypothetical protein
MLDEKLAHLMRALGRYRDEALASARGGRDRAFAQGASKGFGGNVLAQIGREYDDAAKHAADAMAKHTYELMGDNSSAVSETLERALH